MKMEWNYSEQIQQDYYQYKATVIGEGESVVQEILHKDYKESMTIAQALKLSVDAIKKFLGENFDINRIDAAFVNAKDNKMIKLSQEEIEKYK